MNLEKIISEEAQNLIELVNQAPQKAIFHTEKALDRILIKDGIEDSEQIDFFENETKSLLTEDPTGSQLFEELVTAAEDDNHHNVSQLLTEIYEWLSSNYKEVEGI